MLLLLLRQRLLLGGFLVGHLGQLSAGRRPCWRRRHILVPGYDSPRHRRRRRRWTGCWRAWPRWRPFHGCSSSSRGGALHSTGQRARRAGEGAGGGEHRVNNLILQDVLRRGKRTPRREGKFTGKHCVNEAHAYCTATQEDESARHRIFRGHAPRVVETGDSRGGRLCVIHARV